MARRPAKTLTELELEIMQVIWDAPGPLGVEAMREALRAKGKAYAPATIRTMLGILLDKRFVAREKVGRGFDYRPAVPREKAQAGMLSDLVQRVFDGSATALTASLLGSEKVSNEDLAAMKRLIAQRERESKR